MIEKAQKEDLIELVQIGERMFKESQYKNLTFNREKVWSLFRHFIEHPEGIFLMYKNSGIKGFLVGGVFNYEFADEKYAHELYLYVDPEYRNKGLARELIEKYINLAKELGAVDINIENSTLVETEKTEKLFEHMGFSRVGGNYMMRIK